MGTCKIVTLSGTIVAIILAIIALVKLNKKSHPENYIGCAYALGGGNTAYCNDWITAQRNGDFCKLGCQKICCKKALECCNQISTCGNGKSCLDKAYMPTKDNKLMYDSDYNIDNF